MFRHALRALPIAVLSMIPAAAQAGVPAEIAQQFRFVNDAVEASESETGYCQNGARDDFSYSANARCADAYGRLLRELRSRDQVIERMIAERRSTLSAEDLAETERRHGQLHQLIDAVLKFYNLFTARKGSATY